MGAPAGARAGRIPTRPLDTARLPLRPVMVTVAGAATDCFLTMAQIAASGIQIRVEACSGVSFGNSLFGETHRGSISRPRRPSPFDSTWVAGAPPPKSISMRQRPACPDESRNRNVGGVISGDGERGRSEEHT